MFDKTEIKGRNSAMNVGLYVPSWPPGLNANGIITYASHLVPALRRLGHEVFLFTDCQSSKYDPTVTDLRDFVPKRTLWSRLMWHMDPDTSLFNASSRTLANAVTYLTAKHNLDVFEIDEA